MESKLDILRIYKSNNLIERLNTLKLQTYNELIDKIKAKMKLSKYYIIYYQSEDEKFKINDDKTYKLVKDKVFIHEINDLNESFYTHKHNNIPISIQEKLDEKYDCHIFGKINNNKPLMCYQCKKYITKSV